MLRVKRSRVLSHLKSFNADIVFLKETHLRLKYHIRLRKAWISQVSHSRHDGSSKGVAILINKKVQFTNRDHHRPLWSFCYNQWLSLPDQCSSSQCLHS